jgi:hypothetical protein
VRSKEEVHLNDLLTHKFLAYKALPIERKNLKTPMKVEEKSRYRLVPAKNLTS